VVCLEKVELLGTVASRDHQGKAPGLVLVESQEVVDILASAERVVIALLAGQAESQEVVESLVLQVTMLSLEHLVKVVHLDILHIAEAVVYRVSLEQVAILELVQLALLVRLDQLP